MQILFGEQGRAINIALKGSMQNYVSIVAESAQVKLLVLEGIISFNERLYSSGR